MANPETLRPLSHMRGMSGMSLLRSIAVAAVIIGSSTGFSPAVLRPLASTTMDRSTYCTSHSIKLSNEYGGTRSSSQLFAAAKATEAAAKAIGVKRTASGNYILRGKLKRTLEKIFISPAKLGTVLKATSLHLLRDWKEILVIATLIYIPIPVSKGIFKLEKGGKWDKEKFEISKTRNVAMAISEIGMLSGFIYSVDIVVLLLEKLHFDFVHEFPVGPYAGAIVTALWCARHLSSLKKYLIRQFVLKGQEYADLDKEEIAVANVSGKTPKVKDEDGSKRRARLSRQAAAKFANKFGDVVICVASVLVVLDLLNIRIGFLLRSIFGFSSLASLTFSLASRNVVGEFISSVAIQGTNMFRVGEKIWLSDGTMGTVTHLGWLHTHVRRPDELIMRIPNSQLSGARMANISRTTMSQVRQTIAIKYQDIKKLHALSDAIKDTIKNKEGCQELLVTNGTRPFRVHWREYKEKNLEVVVDVHFKVRPNSDAFFDVQEKVLDAIAEACQANDVEFSFGENKSDKSDAPAKISTE